MELNRSMQSVSLPMRMHASGLYLGAAFCSSFFLVLCIFQVLGALAMIDKGELDWKVIAIRQGDPLFSKLKNGLQDVERYCPGLISGIREWFRWYKLPTDNALSVFGHEERAVSASVAREVVLHAHRHYVEFLQQETERRRKKMAEGRRVEESKQRLTDEASIDEKELSSFWIPLKE